MTFSDKSTIGKNYSFSEQIADKKCGGRWTGINIAAMVLGFVFFWPVGLVILYWILKGRDVRDLPAALRGKWQEMRGGSYSGTGNVVFNEYQQTQYERINEIKAEIDSRKQRFAGI